MSNPGLLGQKKLDLLASVAVLQAVGLKETPKRSFETSNGSPSQESSSLNWSPHADDAVTPSSFEERAVPWDGDGCWKASTKSQESPQVFCVTSLKNLQNDGCMRFDPSAGCRTCRLRQARYRVQSIRSYPAVFETGKNGLNRRCTAHGHGGRRPNRSKTSEGPSIGTSMILPWCDRNRHRRPSVRLTAARRRRRDPCSQRCADGSDPRRTS